jgi:hypothetical protein
MIPPRGEKNYATKVIIYGLGISLKLNKFLCVIVRETDISA